ncbi:MAG TPA: helicase HerA-like domain-containing protein [Gemmatimonadaceae bacterium]|nr:helicase HerA-like domain-containing protein [Gemmatimonadaceae bacterium]
MDKKVLDAAHAAFPKAENAVTLGAIVHDGEADPEPIVSIPIAMMNRHGLIAGATGTGKTRTLQLIAEQLSQAGVPVFVADIKGDISGLGAPGASNDRITTRAKETGFDWKPAAFPVEFLSLSGTHGAQLRATVSSFGPLLLSKVLGLNDTQASVMSLVFKFCDDKGLLLLDFSDLRAVLEYLTNDGADQLKSYGGMSKATVGVLLRDMVELEQQGAQAFFGEPEFDIHDLMQQRDGKGLISILELEDIQDKPALFSTFMLWMLATLYHELPEVGDIDKPKLVFFFDEAHLIFDDASKALLDQIQQVVRLIRSKGVGVFFITQSPKDINQDVLAQLGHRVQHALRAFTPDDDKALKAAARTFPKTPFYDVEETLTTLGIGEAFVTVLSPRGVPTPPFATRLIPPASTMGPLPDLDQRIASSQQVKKYATAIDRDSARERLASRVSAPPPQAAPAQKQKEQSDWQPPPAPAPASRRGAQPPPSTFDSILKSPIARSAARTATTMITRGILGAIMGKRSSSRW